MKDQSNLPFIQRYGPAIIVLLLLWIFIAISSAGAQSPGSPSPTGTGTLLKYTEPGTVTEVEQRFDRLRCVDTGSVAKAIGGGGIGAAVGALIGTFISRVVLGKFTVIGSALFGGGIGALLGSNNSVQCLRYWRMTVQLNNGKQLEMVQARAHFNPGEHVLAYFYEDGSVVLKYPDGYSHSDKVRTDPGVSFSR